ncbi:SapC family protein [Streptomyces peucetius]|uniref:SapC family protein n=1 Tax=Streptomyces peucetius TaxID=1950 RepID=A0ABY6IE09_STRPE|nr:SapC family protein [Streptomyces peucetius]UYQ64944.1 SapC family protein [Streptomyces peucetius]
MRPVPLNKEEHASLRVTLPQTERYGAPQQLATLLGAEFPEAAVTYPIVFSEGPRGLTPCALLGLERGRNQYVTQDGEWRPHAYRPASVRAYPFFPVVEDDEEMSVYIDADYDGWSTVEGERLFEEDGSLTPLLTERVELLLQCAREVMPTRDFMKELLRLDLLEQRTITMPRPGGATVEIGNIWVISEERLREIGAGDSPADLLSLHLKGYLRLIHAHLVSLHNPTRLYGELVDG